MSLKEYGDCLNKTDLININVGLLKPFYLYDELHKIIPKKFKYPDIELDSLIHPFKEHEEMDFLYSHIGIILKNRYIEFGKHKNLFASKTRVDATSIEGIIKQFEKKGRIMPSKYFKFEKEYKFINNKGYSDLTNILLGTECATITDQGLKGFRTFYYKAKIVAKDDILVNNFLKKSQKNDIIIPSSLHELASYKKKLRKKLYESIAWSGNSEGTKHFAAAAFLYTCTDKRFIIDIVSKAGIYTRICKERDSTKIKHTMLQRKNKFIKKIPKKWVFGNWEKFIIYCVEYKRNNNWSLTAPWVDIEKEWIANPKKLDYKEGIETHKLITLP